jgi:hypothetical protein
MYTVPVDFFVFKKTVMFVHYFPQGFKISARVIGIFFDFYAGSGKIKAEK